jgi:hypothetical protein
LPAKINTNTGRCLLIECRQCGDLFVSAVRMGTVETEMRDCPRGERFAVWYCKPADATRRTRTHTEGTVI